MPIHPAPPQDLPGKVEAFRQTVQAVIDLGRGLSEEQLASPTDCPGWSVADQIAHVAALEAHLEGMPSPEVDLSEAEHVRNEVGAFTERGVQARRGRSRDSLVAELEYLLGKRMDSLASPGLEPDSIVPGSFGPAPVSEVLRLRTLDVWAHEQDIREAVGRPGDLDSPAAAVFVATAFDVVPRAVARGAEVPVGDTVIIELTGPVTGRIGVRVEEGDGGKARGTVLFGTAEADEGAGGHATTTTLRAIGADAQITTIKLSTEAFARLAAGRRTPDEVTWTASGDEQAAARVLAALRFTP